jgi:hypothetical protein
MKIFTCKFKTVLVAQNGFLYLGSVKAVSSNLYLEENKLTDLFHDDYRIRNKKSKKYFGTNLRKKFGTCGLQFER